MTAGINCINIADGHTFKVCDGQTKEIDVPTKEAFRHSLRSYFFGCSIVLNNIIIDTSKFTTAPSLAMLSNVVEVHGYVKIKGKI